MPTDTICKTGETRHIVAQPASASARSVRKAHLHARLALERSGHSSPPRRETPSAVRPKNPRLSSSGRRDAVHGSLPKASSEPTWLAKHGSLPLGNPLVSTTWRRPDRRQLRQTSSLDGGMSSARPSRVARYVCLPDIEAGCRTAASRTWRSMCRKCGHRSLGLHSAPDPRKVGPQAGVEGKPLRHRACGLIPRRSAGRPSGCTFVGVEEPGRREGPQRGTTPRPSWRWGRRRTRSGPVRAPWRHTSPRPRSSSTLPRRLPLRETAQSRCSRRP